MGTAIEQPVSDWVKLSFVMAGQPGRQSDWMPNITNDSLTQSVMGCSIAVPIWQQ